MRRIVASTFACAVSVKSRNLVPVRVLKHCMRKFSVSSTSRPDGGSGRLGARPVGVMTVPGGSLPLAPAAALVPLTLGDAPLPLVVLVALPAAEPLRCFSGLRRVVMAWTLEM